MILAIPFPVIDPVLFEIGPIFGFSLAIRWYALAYVAGILGCWYVVKRLAATWPGAPDERTIDDFVVWITFGIILGGRLGYVLFYKPEYYLANPAEIVFVWQGGMSYHGGMLGVVGAVLLFARQRKIRLLILGDAVACAVPIGLFFGRLANFINGELWGRVSDVPWAMVFPHAGPLPRHPSQLYEAGLEGVLLLLVMLAVWRFTGARHRAGFLTGVYLVGYGSLRAFVELFREPDAHLGFLFAGATMGQLLSAPMIAIGVWLMLRAKPADAPSPARAKGPAAKR